MQQRRRDLLLALVQARLDDLQVPVAEVAVDEGVGVLNGVGEVVGLELLGHAGDRPLQAREQPAVLDVERARRRLDLARVQQDQPAGVPELVGQLLALLDLVVGEAHVLGRGHRQQAEAQGVGAAGVDLLERVDPGPEALRHPPPVAGLDHRVDVDVAEGDVAGELDPHHHHPRDPEEEDVAGRGQEAGRVEGAQLRRVVGPAERGEGPERRAEPGVEHVLVLAQRRAVAVGAALRRDLLDDLSLARVAVPDRDLVPPPQLARDAPGPDLPHPVEVDAFPLLGRDPHLVALRRLDRRLRQLVHAAEPLQADQRLDPLAGAVRERDRVGVGLLGAQPALGAERRDDRRLGLADAHPRVLAGGLVHATVLADHADLLEPVAAADLEVVDVVAGGDLQRPGAELGVDVGVGDDRQAAPDQRQHRELADQVRVTLVVGVHGDGGVGEHRLRAHRRHGQDPVGALDRIVDREQRVIDLAVLDLEVGDRRARPRVPADHVVVAVDVALVVEPLEDLVDGADVAVVEGEALALVVERGAEALVLLDDLRAVLLFPGPDPLDEGLAAELVARGALLAELFLDFRLGGDAGVVGAEDPQRVAAPHAVEADQRVLDRPVQRVTHVQRPGDVGRRDRDREVLLRRARRLGMEIPALHPFAEDPPLDRRRFVAGRLLEALAGFGVHGGRV